MILSKFAIGEIKLLVVIKTLREGFDAQVDYVFIGQQLADKNDIIQMRGRALRPFGDPDKVALVLTVNEEIARLASFDGTFEYGAYVSDE